jgi:hypothetical protein
MIYPWSAALAGPGFGSLSGTDTGFGGFGGGSGVGAGLGSIVNLYNTPSLSVIEYNSLSNVWVALSAMFWFILVGAVRAIFWASLISFSNWINRLTT